MTTPLELPKITRTTLSGCLGAVVPLLLVVVVNVALDTVTLHLAGNFVLLSLEYKRSLGWVSCLAIAFLISYVRNWKVNPNDFSKMEGVDLLLNTAINNLLTPVLALIAVLLVTRLPIGW